MSEVSDAKNQLMDNWSKLQPDKQPITYNLNVAISSLTLNFKKTKKKKKHFHFGHFLNLSKYSLATASIGWSYLKEQSSFENWWKWPIGPT